MSRANVLLVDGRAIPDRITELTKAPMNEGLMFFGASLISVRLSSLGLVTSK